MMLYKPIGIVDLGFSNVSSIEKALSFLNYKSIRIRSSFDCKEYKKIIFPGVGNFSAAYLALVDVGLHTSIIDYCNKNGHFLGICLGMQLLFDSGLEGGYSQGMGLINGFVQKICPHFLNEKIPHNGWNEVRWELEDPLCSGISQGKDFYFNHSYSVHTREEYILGKTPYGKDGIISSVRRLNIWGTQFHPEKSQAVGLKMLKNFIEYND